MIATYHSLQSHRFSAKFYYQLLKIAQYISLQRPPNICLKSLFSLRKLVLHLYMKYDYIFALAKA